MKSPGLALSGSEDLPEKIIDRIQRGKGNDPLHFFTGHDTLCTECGFVEPVPV